MTALWLTIALIGVVGWVMYQFNTLVSLSNDIDEAWVQIDSQFVRRYELIATLLPESKLAAAKNAFTPAEKSKTEPALVAEIAALPANAELRQTLTDIEQYLRVAVPAYNELVDELNARAGKFPNNLLASLFGVELRERFQPEAK